MLEALAAANVGHAVAYGDDDVTRACEAAFDELFGRHVDTFLTYNGTGANMVALAALLGPAEAVVCTSSSHVNVDEAGAPERFLGAKLIDLPAPDGKLDPSQLQLVDPLFDGPHHVRPSVLSITQSTELGTVYSPEEISALCAAGHERQMRVHVDGARIANAVAALGRGRDGLRAMTIDAGVDVISFGGTKNALMGAEAVVFLTPGLVERVPRLRKQANQLASKMRFVSAQFLAIIGDDLWIELAANANAMCRRLWEATGDIEGVTHAGPPQVNSLFPVLPRAAIGPLQQWCFFWEWDPAIGQVRWMTSWDTTEDDVETYANGIRHYLASAIDAS